MTLFSNNNNNLSLKYIDLFCGIGGFRVAKGASPWVSRGACVARTEIVCKEYQIKPLCVFSSDLDRDALRSAA